MKRWAPVVAVLLALGGVALAQSVVSVRQWFVEGFFVGPRSYNPSATADNRVQAVCQGTFSHNFGSLADGYCSNLYEDAGVANVALTNCAAPASGSVCLVTPGATTDDAGVQPWTLGLWYRCYVTSVSGTTATVRLHACNNMGDAGTLDPGPGPLRVALIR